MILKPAALLLLSYSLHLANLNKLQVATNSILVCIYDTSHLFLQVFLIICEFDLALFSFLIYLVELLLTLHYSLCCSMCKDILVLFTRLHDACTHVGHYILIPPSVYVTLVHTFDCYILVLHPFMYTRTYECHRIFLHNHRIHDARTHGFPASVGLAHARPNHSEKIPHRMNFWVTKIWQIWQICLFCHAKPNPV